MITQVAHRLGSMAVTDCFLRVWFGLVISAYQLGVTAMQNVERSDFHSSIEKRKIFGIDPMDL